MGPVANQITGKLRNFDCRPIRLQDLLICISKMASVEQFLLSTNQKAGRLIMCTVTCKSHDWACPNKPEVIKKETGSEKSERLF